MGRTHTTLTLLSRKLRSPWYSKQTLHCPQRLTQLMAMLRVQPRVEPCRTRICHRFSRKIKRIYLHSRFFLEVQGCQKIQLQAHAQRNGGGQPGIKAGGTTCLTEKTTTQLGKTMLHISEAPLWDIQASRIREITTTRTWIAFDLKHYHSQIVIIS